MNGNTNDVDLTSVVTGIWAELLEVPDLKPDDDVFKLGAHSLMATQVASRLRQRLGRPVPVRMAVRARSSAELAAQLGKTAEAGAQERREAPHPEPSALGTEPETER